MKKFTIIGVSGLAGSGKDTFYQLLSRRRNFKRFALADELKLAMRDELINDYNIDVLTCSREDKEVIRPRLVEFAKKVRLESNGRHWVELLEKKILPFKGDVCITDVRYDDFEKDEIFWLKKEMNGVLVHVSQYEQLDNIRIFTPAPNEEEARNDPKIKKKADYIIEWPKVLSYNNSMDLDRQLSPYIDRFLLWLDKKCKD